MAKIFKGRKSKKESVEIKNFAKMPDVIELPNLLRFKRHPMNGFCKEKLTLIEGIKKLDCRVFLNLPFLLKALIKILCLIL